MASKNNNALIAAIVFAALVIAGSIVFFALYTGGNQKGATDVTGADADRIYYSGIADLDRDQPYIGDEDAPVTIVEFSDYRCGFCQRFFDETLPQIKENYVDNDLVKLVYRDYLLGYSGDYESALIAECSRDQGGDEAFFEMHNKIFETIADGFDYQTYSDYAAEIGLDAEELRQCYNSQKFREEILADVDYGKSIGVSGTPAFFINGQFVSGAQPFESFQRLIEMELTK